MPNKHPTETAEYWLSLASSERAFAAHERSGRRGSAESIRLHERNAEEYEARAKSIEEASNG